DLVTGVQTCALPIYGRRHRVLTDPEMEILTAAAPGLEASRALVRQGRLVRRPEVRRAAEEPGNVLREQVEHLARGLPAGDALRIRREDGEVAIPPRRQVSSLHLIDLARQLGVLRPVRREERSPSASKI